MGHLSGPYTIQPVVQPFWPTLFAPRAHTAKPSCPTLVERIEFTYHSYLQRRSLCVGRVRKLLTNRKNYVFPDYRGISSSHRQK